MKNILKKSKKKGSTLIEYGLVAALVGVAAIGGLEALGDGLVALFNDIVTLLQA
jgi:Flp pilus assembly pilin Flp